MNAVKAKFELPFGAFLVQCYDHSAIRSAPLFTGVVYHNQYPLLSFFLLFVFSDLQRQHESKLEDITNRFESIKLTLSVSADLTFNPFPPTVTHALTQGNNFITK